MKSQVLVLLMVLLVLTACGTQPTVDTSAIDEAQKAAEEAQAKVAAAEATAAAAQAEAEKAAEAGAEELAAVKATSEAAVAEAEAAKAEAEAAKAEAEAAKASVVEETEPVEFTFATWGDITFFEDCFQRFQAAHPEYANVTFNGVTVDEDSTLLQRLMTDSMAKNYETLPDMSEMSTNFMSQLAAAGLLVDLTDQMMPYKDNISPGVWEGISYEGKVYAVPWMANSSMIWYRKDVFDMAGVNPDDIQTWNDFIEAGKTITNFEYPDGRQRYMVDIGASEADFMTMQLMLGQQGIGLFDPETGETIVGTDPRFQQAFETYTHFATEGIALPIDGWDAPWFAAMSDGTIATYISANWWDQVIKGGDLGEDQAGKWRAMMLPAIEEGSGRATLESGSANVVIINKPGVDVDLAWKMAEYCYFNKDVTPDLLKSNNLVPAYLPALDDSRFTAADEFYGGQEVGKLDKAVQEQAKAFPFTANFNEASSYVAEQLQLVMNGEKTVEEGVADAAEAIRTNIGE